MSEFYDEVFSAEISRLNEGTRETDPFDGGVTMPLAGTNKDSKAEFYSLDDRDIRTLQKSVDKTALEYIEKAEKEGRITAEGADYLRSYYEDSMQSYAEFYDAMINVLGRPLACHRNDLEPGEKDDTNYSETYITPNNAMRLIYPPISDDPDMADNHMFFTLPGMKNVVRAVTKISKGGKYDVAYQKELEALKKQYGVRSRKYNEEKARLIPVHLRLRDVLRCTISVPTYDSIEKVIKRFTEHGGCEIAETKDKFQENLSAHDKRFGNNKKNYRDKKICFKNGNIFFEVQFKIQLLEKADEQTHVHYEKLREKIDEYNGADPKDQILKNRLQREKTWLEWGIQNINRRGLDEYNLFILDIALKKDTRYKKEHIRQLRQQFFREKDEEKRQKLQNKIYTASQTLNASPVCKEAQEFILRNFMVRPYKALNQQEEFVEARPELQSFAMLNYFLVSPRYRATIQGKKPDNYDEIYNQADKERKNTEQQQLDEEYRLYLQSRKKASER